MEVLFGVPSVFFSLLAALSWGGSDFVAGLASKRISVFVTTMAAEVLGMALILPLALLTRDPWLSPGDLLWASLAGLAGAGAIFFLYFALSTGKMGVVAPLAGVVAAGVAASVGLALDGLPGVWQLAGFGLGLAGIWLLSDARLNVAELKGVPLPLLAGICSGVFFVAMHQASGTAVFWPNFWERAVGLGLLLVVAGFYRPPVRLKAAPWRLLILLSVLDTAGALLFTLAVRTGRLDVATVLSSLYPGGTVLLAWVFLKERLTPLQGVGVLLALGAIVLIAA